MFSNIHAETEEFNFYKNLDDDTRDKNMNMRDYYSQGVVSHHKRDTNTHSVSSNSIQKQISCTSVDYSSLNMKYDEEVLRTVFGSDASSDDESHMQDEKPPLKTYNWIINTLVTSHIRNDIDKFNQIYKSDYSPINLKRSNRSQRERNCHYRMQAVSIQAYGCVLCSCLH